MSWLPGHCGGKLEQERAQEVGQYDGRAQLRLRLSQPWQLLVAQVEASDFQANAVDKRVLGTGRDALELVVEPEHRLIAEYRGGDREHAGAGADIDQRTGCRV